MASLTLDRIVADLLGDGRLVVAGAAAAPREVVA